MGDAIYAGREIIRRQKGAAVKRTRLSIAAVWVAACSVPDEKERSFRFSRQLLLDDSSKHVTARLASSIWMIKVCRILAQSLGKDEGSRGLGSALVVGQSGV
jgi:hypothetical protein